MRHSRRIAVAPVSDDQLPLTPNEAPKRLSTVLIGNLHLLVGKVREPQYSMDSSVGPRRARPAQRAGIHRDHLVARPLLAVGLLADGHHPSDQRFEIRRGPAHLHVKSHRAQLRTTASLHHCHCLPKRQVTSDVHEDEAQQLVRRRDLGVAMLHQ